MRGRRGRSVHMWIEMMSGSLRAIAVWRSFVPDLTAVVVAHQKVYAIVRCHWLACGRTNVGLVP